jgi:hypothetical protein
VVEITMSGRCWIVVTPELLTRLRERTDMTVLDDDLHERAGTYETDSGAILHTCEKRLVRISTTLLADGEHGQQCIVLKDDGSIRFDADRDT